MPDLFIGETHSDAKDVSDLNLLNIYDYILNWECLDNETRAEVTTIVEGLWNDGEVGDSGYNRSAGGIKGKSDKALAELMLLYAGLGVRDTLSTAHRIIPSNVRDFRGYRDRNTTSLGFLDPRAANGRIKSFFNEYDPSELMPPYHATRVLFNAPKDIWYFGGSTVEARDRFNRFFSKVSGRLDRWHDKGSIVACFARFEIAIQRLAGSIFQPHVHAVIWHHPDHCMRFLKNAFKRGEIEEIQEPQSSWDDIKGFIRYMMQVESIGSRYRIERDEANLREYNQLARQGLWNYIELQKHTSAEVQKHREFKRAIPKVGKKHSRRKKK